MHQKIIVIIITIFLLSCFIQFTALAIMQLHEKGQLNINQALTFRFN